MTADRGGINVACTMRNGPLRADVKDIVYTTGENFSEGAIVDSELSTHSADSLSLVWDLRWEAEYVCLTNLILEIQGLILLN
jgi:hypothetical protein